MANFKTRLESFRERLDSVSPTPAVLFKLFVELVDILIKNQKRDEKKTDSGPSTKGD